jgi:aminomethyltransferase
MTPRISLLHTLHVAAGARFTDFAGGSMPLSYPNGTVAEHLACRSSAAMFDVSHLATLEFRGEGEFSRLASLLSNDLTAVGVGGTQYTLLLNDTGGVIDDLVVWRVSTDVIHVLANASNVESVQAMLGGVDITAGRVLLAVQGPKAPEMLARWRPDAVVERHRIQVLQLDHHQIVMAGTGYTGEAGAELALPPEVAREVWQTLIDCGVEPAGLGARDTLRLEAGLALHGADLGPDVSPFESGVGWAVAKGHHFPGAAAAEQARETATRHRVGIVTEGRRPPRGGATVVVDGEAVGEVTSGNWSPVLQQGIALARVPRSVRVGDRVSLQVRDHSLAGTVVRLPFVRGGSAAL